MISVKTIFSSISSINIMNLCLSCWLSFPDVVTWSRDKIQEFKYFERITTFRPKWEPLLDFVFSQCPLMKCRHHHFPRVYVKMGEISKSEPVFVDLLRRPGIDSQPAGPVRQPYFSYRPARLHRLAKSIPRNRFLGSINVYKYGLGSKEIVPAR
jgi:hypothetical protein